MLFYVEFNDTNQSTFVFLSECQNAFALVVRPPTEQENLLFSFQLTAEDTLKSAWLKTLCRQVANTICRADAVSRRTHTYIETWPLPPQIIPLRSGTELNYLFY